jgi:IMP and pyridine-specific 5'-nucleotidase
MAVPFVLLSQPTTIHRHPDSQGNAAAVNRMAANAHARYSQIFRDVQDLINDHISHHSHQQQHHSSPGQDGHAHHRAPPASKLKMLVPTVGSFFTPLPLVDAFAYQDQKRFISSRRFVAPSFNDVRLILNTAQVMSLVRSSKLDLVTFDGDVTLYDDGAVLTPDNPCIPRILSLLQRGTRIGIVTAAGYLEAEKYYARLYGLLEAVAACSTAQSLEHKLVVMGGEANFLFTYTPSAPHKLTPVPAADWQLPAMKFWTEPLIKELLDTAQAALSDCISTLRLPAFIVRKERAVGIVPNDGIKLPREQLEETVLVVQRIVEMSPAGKKIPFCAFNGGNDVFVDIGDKSWGVRACQQYFGGIEGGKSLHVGDQFLSAGANDFKVRRTLMPPNNAFEGRDRVADKE